MVASRFATALSALSASASAWGPPHANNFGPPSNNWALPSWSAPAVAAHPTWTPSSANAQAPSSSGPNSWNNSWWNANPSAQSGWSTWGTMNQSALPNWMNGPLPQGTPWGNRSCGNTNQLDNGQIPNTGMVRQYHWTVSDALLAPDGFTKEMIVVNGQYPGPLLEANWGDWIEVTVVNNRSEGTSIHWHGFLQTGTPFMDGTPGISQCPIAPGASFTYRFRAELYGTSWWHSHYSAQYIDGMVGPIVIHGPVTTPYDIDLGPVVVSDWFHGYYENLVYQIQHAAPGTAVTPPEAENVLINGKASFVCGTVPNYQSDPVDATCTPDAPLAQFKVQSGKKHLLRFINTGAEGVLFASVDGHQLEVVANDFVPVEPYNTSYITLAVGQRTDAIFYATGKPTDSVWLRVTGGPSGEIPGKGALAPPGTGGCNINTGFNNETLAAMYYEDADTSIPPNTTSDIPIEPTYIAPFACANDIHEGTPFYPIPAMDADINLDLVITGGYNSSGDFVWWFNNQTFLVDFNDPILLDAKLGVKDFNVFRQVYDWSNATSVRLNVTGVGFPAVHPMHVHGHNMQILSSGIGYWDGSITNPENPARRDTWALPPLGYSVFQWNLTNPGVWPFHCHIAWHTSEGMLINFIEGNVEEELEVPYIMAQTCRDWSAWTGQNVVNIIDSGL